MRIISMYPTTGGGSLITAINLTETLKEMGYYLKVIDPWEYRILIKERFPNRSIEEINELTKEVTNRYLIKAIKDFKPDLFFTVFGLNIRRGILRLLKRAGVISFCWFLDDPWWFEKSKRIAPNYDIFFTHEPTTVKMYKEDGIKNVYYLPEACNPNIHKEIELTEEERARYSCDLSFVGRPYSNRIALLDRLTDYDLGIWGPIWDELRLSRRLKRCLKGGEVSQEEMVKIFNASKIVINIHPTYGLNGIESGFGICPRTFAIAGCGAFQLVDYRREMDNLFRVGRELIVFNDIDELKRLIEYYLLYPERRYLIAKRSQERVYSEHTYRHRIDKIFSILKVFKESHNGSI